MTAIRVRRAPADRFDDRRRELAEAALLTLGELGYARTSLREIANNSPFTHGVLHYYFEDKLDLVLYSVGRYMGQRVSRYDELIAGATSPEGLLEAFVTRVATTMRDDAPMGCVWYDLRTQSLFEESLRETVSQIEAAWEDTAWRVVSRYAELAGRPVALTPGATYGVLDGLFHQALLGKVHGDQTALTTMVEQVRAVMPLMLR